MRASANPLDFLQATVTNTDSVAHTGVTLLVRLPDGIYDFLRANVSGPFVSTSCTELGNSALCSSGEQLVFSLATLDPSESVSVTLPPVFTSLPHGLLVDYHAIVTGSGADDRAAKTIPEPGRGAILAWRSGLLAAIVRARRRRFELTRSESPCSPRAGSAGLRARSFRRRT